MRRGFKAEAERIATEIRSELRLPKLGKLDIWELAEHLAISVFTLGDVAQVASTNSFVHPFFSRRS